jgi:RNA polymerase sigma-70 factor (ECF subfamily)
LAIRFLNKKSSWSNKSDEELLKIFKKSEDGLVIEILFERYSHLLLGLSLNYIERIDDCQDIVMEVFEKLGSKILEFDIKNFKHWITTVVRNECLMLIRKEKRHERTSIDNEKFNIERNMELSVPEHHIDEDINPLKINGFIKLLKTEQQICITKFYFDNKSYKEITEETGYSLKEVKSYLQNAKRKLKILMTENNDRE